MQARIGKRDGRVRARKLVDLVRREIENGAETVEEIHKAGQRAAGLTRQLLAFGRKQVLSPTPLDLGAVVTDLAPMLRRLLGEDVTLAVEPEQLVWRPSVWMRGLTSLPVEFTPHPGQGF